MADESLSLSLADALAYGVGVFDSSRTICDIALSLKQNAIAASTEAGFTYARAREAVAESRNIRHVRVLRRLLRERLRRNNEDGNRTA